MSFHIYELQMHVLLHDLHQLGWFIGKQDQFPTFRSDSS